MAAEAAFQHEQLSERVIFIPGCNPGGRRLQGTNTYLIGTGKSRILVDTGNANIPGYTELLKSVLDQLSVSLQEIIVTHWHPDHVGGVDDVCRALSQKFKVSKIKRTSVPDPPLEETDYSYVEDQHVFKTEGATLRVHHNPGHSEEHLILYLVEEDVVFSGDAVLGGTTTTVEDLPVYMKSLHDLLDLNPAMIYPGHGYMIKNPKETIQGYIKHRQMRENQILECLKAQNGSEVGLAEMVKTMYADLVEHLLPVATINVKQHLAKLQAEGKIVSTEENKWKLT